GEGRPSLQGRVQSDDGVYLRQGARVLVGRRWIVELHSAATDLLTPRFRSQPCFRLKLGLAVAFRQRPALAEDRCRTLGRGRLAGERHSYIDDGHAADVRNDGVGQYSG